MPKYICKNRKCPKYNKEQLINKSTMKFVAGEFIDSGSICPSCESIMESVNPKGFTTFMHGSENICKK